MRQSLPHLNHPKEGSKTTFETYTTQEGWGSFKNSSRLGAWKVHSFIAKRSFFCLPPILYYAPGEKKYPPQLLKIPISAFSPSCSSDVEQKAAALEHSYVPLRAPQQSIISVPSEFVWVSLLWSRVGTAQNILGMYTAQENCSLNIKASSFIPLFKQYSLQYAGVWAPYFSPPPLA